MTPSLKLYKSGALDAGVVFLRYVRKICGIEVMMNDAITRAMMKKSRAFLMYGQRLISLKNTDGIFPRRKENGSIRMEKKAMVCFFISLLIFFIVPYYNTV